MRFGFTAAAYGWREGLRAIPRIVVGNLVAILAARRALALHEAGGPKQWDKTRHIFPARRRAGHEPFDPLHRACACRLGGRARAEPGHDPGGRGDGIRPARPAGAAPLPRNRGDRVPAARPGRAARALSLPAGPYPPARSAPYPDALCRPGLRRGRFAARVMPAGQISVPAGGWGPEEAAGFSLAPGARALCRRRAGARTVAARHDAGGRNGTRAARPLVPRRDDPRDPRDRPPVDERVGDDAARPRVAVARDQRPAWREPGGRALAVALRPRARRKPARQRADRRGQRSAELPPGCAGSRFSASPSRSPPSAASRSGATRAARLRFVRRRRSL